MPYLFTRQFVIKYYLQSFALILCPILLLFSLLSSLVVAANQPPPLPFQLPHIKIVTEEFPPYNYTKDGKLKGFSTDIIREVCREVGIHNPDIKVYPWIRAYKLAMENPNTLIFTISRTSVREPLFKWSGALVPVNSYLYAKASNHTLTINSLAEAKTKRIGTVRGTGRSQYLRSQGFKQGINLFTVNSYEQNFKKLMKGRIDLWAANELNLYYLLTHHYNTSPSVVRRVFKVDTGQQMEMAFGKQTDDRVVNIFKNALQTIKNNGTYDRVFQEHFPDITRKNHK